LAAEGLVEAFKARTVAYASYRALSFEADSFALQDTLDRFWRGRFTFWQGTLDAVVPKVRAKTRSGPKPDSPGFEWMQSPLGVHLHPAHAADAEVFAFIAGLQHRKRLLGHLRVTLHPGMDAQSEPEIGALHYLQRLLLRNGLPYVVDLGGGERLTTAAIFEAVKRINGDHHVADAPISVDSDRVPEEGFDQEAWPGAADSLVAWVWAMGRDR